MPETLTLTTPIVPPARTTYVFARLTLDLEAEYVEAAVRGSDGVTISTSWSGPSAVALMTSLNTANLSAGNSLVKRVFTKLVADGKLPPGTVSGTAS